MATQLRVPPYKALKDLRFFDCTLDLRTGPLWQPFILFPGTSLRPNSNIHGWALPFLDAPAPSKLRVSVTSKKSRGIASVSLSLDSTGDRAELSVTGYQAGVEA